MPETAALKVSIKAKPSKEWETVLECINVLGSALADHNHQWTPKERRIYERAVRAVERLIVVE